MQPRRSFGEYGKAGPASATRGLDAAKIRFPNGESHIQRGLVEVHRELMIAAARWMKAAKLASVLSAHGDAFELLELAEEVRSGIPVGSERRRESGQPVRHCCDENRLNLMIEAG
jgi:hypothetical protein